MKTIALLSILLSAACASTTGFDNPDMKCGPGQDIGIEAGLQAPRLSGEMSNERDVQLLVQISNNSHHDVTVARVRVEQLYREDAPYAFDDVYREVNLTIAEGQDHLFELPTTGRWTAVADRDPSSLRSSLSLAATVELASGETYHCRFAAPVPR